MAADTIEAVPNVSTGYNLTDSADFTTLVAGAGNGVIFAYYDRQVIFLKNDTAGAAVFTLKLKTYEDLDAIGITPADPTITVAAGKTKTVKPSSVWSDADGNMTIECDVAGKVLVLRV